MFKLISIVIGYILGYILIKTFICNTIYHGPDTNQIRKKIYIDKQTNKYYRFIPKICFCPLGYKK